MASGDDLTCNCVYHQQAQTLRCNPENPYCSIRKLVNLMENPITSNFVERQTIILNDFLTASPHAFWMRDIPFVSKLLELILEKPEYMTRFRQQFEYLLLLCAVPPMLVCSSEILHCGKDLEAYFTFLGCLLVQFKEAHLTDLVIRAIWCQLEMTTPTGSCCISKEMRRMVAEKSELTEIIGQLAETAEEELYTKLIQLCVCLAEISTKMALILVKVGAIDYLMLRMEPTWKTRNRKFPPQNTSNNVLNYSYSMKLLWLLTDSLKVHPKKSFNRDHLPSLDSLWSLWYVFRAHALKKCDAYKRNNLCAFVLQLLDLFPDMPYVQSGLAEDMALLSVASELGAEGTWAADIKFNNNDVDYHFKKTLLLIICYTAKIFSALQIIENRNVVAGLLKLITPDDNRIWLDQQHSKLTIMALNTLYELVPALLEEVLINNGIIRLIIMLESYNFEAYDLEILLTSLRCLYRIVRYRNCDILNELQTAGLMPTLTTLASKLLNESLLNLVRQRCLARVFCLLQALHKSLTPEDNSILDLCMSYMKKVLNPDPNDPIHDPQLIICGLDLLWHCAFAPRDNLKLFVTKGGVYMLLDIIQRSIFPVKLVGLGVLVDFCEEGSCIAHLVTWRGNGQRLIPMLMDIFRMESERFGVKTKPNGIIADIEVPLMGTSQVFAYVDKKDITASPATMDLLASCRPKIYAILQLLKTRHKDKVEIANEHYKLLNEPISVQDQVTMLVAENYLALKLGETWCEIARDFEFIDMIPIAIDSYIIETLVQAFYKSSLQIRRAQKEILRCQNEKDVMDEKAVYRLLKESKLLGCLKALQKLDHIARTTEHMFRWAHKMMQNRQIETSLQFSNDNAHRTFMNNVGVTNVFKQKVDVESNKIIDPYKQPFDIKPVSPTESEDELTLHTVTTKGSMNSEEMTSVTRSYIITSN